MKKIAIIGGSILFVLILIGAATSSSDNQESNLSPEPAKQEVVEEASSTPKLEYEILDRVENKLDENISILIKPGETNPKAIADKIQKSCKKKCNISLFDDKKAFELDAEYTNKMLGYDVTVEEREAWKEKNTVFLADHLVATVGDSFGPYTEYPLKDSYYRELKGEK
jgi:hypothetical protein